MTGLELITRLAFEHRIMHDEPACESPHDSTECSTHVTHKSLGCTPPHLICHNAYAANKYEMYRGTICDDCGRPAVDCWRFIPI